MLTKLKAITGTGKAQDARLIRYKDKEAFRDAFIKLYNEVAYKGVLKEPSKVIEDFKFFSDNHSTVANADKFVDEMMQEGTKFQGGAHQLDMLKNRPIDLIGKTLSKFEGRIADDVNDCVFDMLFGTAPNEILVEAKNFVLASLRHINQQGKYKQLKAYFSRVNSMDNFHYYFRANSGVQRSDIVDQFKAMLSDLTLRDVNGVNMTRADELFGVMSENLKIEILSEVNKDRKDIFKTMISNLDEKIYKFIKTF